MRLTKLPRSFYLQKTLTVAKQLLGSYLVRRIEGQELVGMIVETEAYLGKDDPAAHTYRGMTPRNQVMFKAGGYLYVYFTYGMHYCCNVVTEEEGIGHAVLLRAVEPVNGLEVIKSNRGIDTNGRKLYNLTNGPAKLCQAFGIARAENGLDLRGDTIFIAKGEPVPSSRIERSTRIGINVARDHEWRFTIKGNPWVSKAP